jgi:hypothetical protein
MSLKQENASGNFAETPSTDRMKNAFFIFFLIFLSACSSQPEHEQAETENASGPADPLVLSVQGPQVLFLWPDSAAMEKMKAQDSESFYIGADDYSFYTSEVMQLADSLKIKNTVTHLPIIDFVTADQKHIRIDRRNDDSKQWGIYFFNGKDAPEMKDVVMLSADTLLNYFKK